MKRIATYTAALGGVIGAVLAPSLAFAAIITPAPPIGTPGSGLTGAGIIRIIEVAVQTLMTVSVVIGVGFFVYGAIQYFALAKPDDGKAKMKNAVIGIALILGIGLILQTVAGLINRGLNVG
jgi:hypothetical protein